jgi:tetratricopeptide (TPR) repeat protein
MSIPDWFRRRTWTSEDQEDFFAHLKRSRPHKRDQYLRIQAVYLQEVGTPEYLEAAIGLLDKIFSDYPDSMELSLGYRQKAECLDGLGRTEDAEQAYQASFSAMRRRPNIHPGTQIGFGLFVVRHRLTHLYKEALDVLGEFTSDSDHLFPLVRYRYFAIYAVISSHWGLREEARTFANRALEAAEQEHSGFRYHPKIGLVTQIDTELHRNLVDIAHP